MSDYRAASKGRIARYLTITAGVTFIAYVIRSLASMLAGRQGAEALSDLTYVLYAVNLLAAIIVAALNRRYTFRSTLAWGIAIPVMVMLEMLYDGLGSMLWRPVMMAMMEQPWDLEMGSRLQLASYGVNIVQFIVWAVLAYLFQRFVLYRDTLDTRGREERAQ